jgi:hypothetical protein
MSVTVERRPILAARASRKSSGPATGCLEPRSAVAAAPADRRRAGWPATGCGCCRGCRRPVRRSPTAGRCPGRGPAGDFTEIEAFSRQDAGPPAATGWPGSRASRRRRAAVDEPGVRLGARLGARDSLWRVVGLRGRAAQFGSARAVLEVVESEPLRAPWRRTRSSVRRAAPTRHRLRAVPPRMGQAQAGRGGGPWRAAWARCGHSPRPRAARAPDPDRGRGEARRTRGSRARGVRRV